MANTFPFIRTEQYLNESKKWIAGLNRRENVFVIFFPKTDRLLRMRQFIDEHNGGRFQFVLLESDLSQLKGKKDVTDLIEKQLNQTQTSVTHHTFEQWLLYFNKKNMPLVIVIPQIEFFWNAEGQQAQIALSYLIDEYHSMIMTLGFSETDISHSSILPFLSDSMRLYENIFYYPLYGKKDSRKFIHYLEEKWQMELKPELVDKILDDCGGHFWLLKEAVRECDADIYLIYPGDGLRFRLDIIHNIFSSSEQKALANTLRGIPNTSIDEMQSLKYLKKMKLINKSKVSINLFTQYILNRNKGNVQLELRHENILLNKIPINKFFSRKELRVLKILLGKEGEAVSREVIAQHIWPNSTEKFYSDWAIDQLISRLRKRLLQLSLPQKILQSVRGKGYLLRFS